MSSAPPQSINLRVVVEKIAAATSPVDLFGSAAEAKKNYRRLAQAVHPDLNRDPEAAEAFRRLSEWWQIASQQLVAGTYGKAKVVTVRSKRASYSVAEKIGSDAIAETFRCYYEKEGKTVAGQFKTARVPRDNDLVQREATTLRTLRRKIAEPVHPFLPELVETIRYRQSGGIIRQANVFAGLDGFFSLEDVLAHYPNGIDPRDMAWMWRRLLYVLGKTHKQGIVHGAVLPNAVLIHPELHGLVLTDWTRAVESSQGLRVISRDYRAWYPREFKLGDPIGPETDIWMAASSMLKLTNPSLEPPGPEHQPLPRPLRAFFRSCFLVRQKRPDDALWLLGAFEEVLERCFGPRKFRPFSMDGYNRKEK